MGPPGLLQSRPQATRGRTGPRRPSRHLAPRPPAFRNPAGPSRRLDLFSVFTKALLRTGPRSCPSWLCQPPAAAAALLVGPGAALHPSWERLASKTSKDPTKIPSCPTRNPLQVCPDAGVRVPACAHCLGSHHPKEQGTQVSAPRTRMQRRCQGQQGMFTCPLCSQKGRRRWKRSHSQTHHREARTTVAEGSNQPPRSEKGTPLCNILSSFTHSCLHASNDERLTLSTKSPFH